MMRHLPLDIGRDENNRGEIAIDLDGEHTRDFVYVEDTVEASILVLQCERCVSEVINVGTRKLITTNEFVNVLIELFQETGAKPEYSPVRAGDLRHSYAGISKAEILLYYTPKIKLKERIRRLLEGCARALEG